MPDPSPRPLHEPARVSGNLVDPLARTIRPATLTIEAGRISAIEDDPTPHPTFLLPGFVDAHVHVESSLLPPGEFARMAVPHGTVATVSDPHEIANVLGIPGVDFMLDDARGVPFTFHFGAPSCVPATALDHAGATIDATAVATLLDRPEIGYLSEMMNYPAVVGGDPEVHAKLAAARRRGKPIDGHAPGLRGTALAAYAAAGISTDHECVAFDEALEKIGLGMLVQIREGSAARNFDALRRLIDEHPDRCMLCSDDKHPDQLLAGHIDALVRRALEHGSDLFDVLRVAAVNPVRHYGLPVGLLQSGDRADFIEVDDLRGLRVRRTIIAGRQVAADGAALWPHRAASTPNRFSARPRSPDDFLIHAPAHAAGHMMRVIGALDGQLVTESLRRPVRVTGGLIRPDPAADLLTIAAVDRYDDRPPARGLIAGFGLGTAAIASSVSHDSHNIVAVGGSEAAIARAVNLVIESRGGLAAVGQGREAVLPLPIAGLMSDRPGTEVAASYAALDRMAKEFGSPLRSPFMTLAFMSLLVIPSLKLGPAGLVDTERSAAVDLIVAG